MRALGLGIVLTLAATPAAAQLSFNSSVVTSRAGDRLDTAYVEAVVRIDIENGPSSVVSALANNTRLLLPLRTFFELAEIRMESFVLRDSAVAVLEPGGVRLRFRPSARLVARGLDTVPYDTMDVVWWDGDLFVETALLDRLLGVTTSVEWSDLSAMIGRSNGLPVIQRGRRERRRLMLRRERPAIDALNVPLRARAIDGAVVTWSLTAATGGPTDQVALDLGMGAGVLGGSAEIRPQFWSNHGESGTELRVSWTRAFNDSRWIRQAGLGDVQSNGRRARLMRGLTLTNAPFVRSNEFDVEQFVGNVPRGWEVELYDGGQLLAYADADALGAFRVPIQLRYGQNPFDLVLYGPGGETIRQKRTIRVPFSRLPDHQIEYALAAGQCRFEACEGLVSADARYGLSSRVTLQGGTDAIFDRVKGSLWQPYAIVSAAPLPSVGLTGELVGNGHVRGAADFEPNMDIRASAGFTSFSRAGAVHANGTLTEATRSEGSLYWRPGWMGGNLFLRGALVYSTGPEMRRSLERLSVTTRHGQIRYGLGLLFDASRSVGIRNNQFAIDASADAYLSGPWPWLKNANVSGQLAVDPSGGITAMRAAAGRRVSRALRLDAGLGWFKGAGVSLELSFNTAAPGPRFGARSRMNSESGSSSLMFANGSLAYDPRSRLTQLGDGSDLGRAGIRGILFRDDNGNGERDHGEPGLAGIPVHVGGWPATTDAEGRFAAWGLFPYELANIEIDSLSFGDPRFILPASVLRVRPSANAFGSISVPVVVGGEVSGFVIFQNEALANVPVLLREMNTGVEITIMTFGDGAFYKAAVPPGEYEVTLPDAVLERLHAAAPPLSIFVPPGAGEKRYEDLQLRLTPSP